MFEKAVQEKVKGGSEKGDVCVFTKKSRFKRFWRFKSFAMQMAEVKCYTAGL